MGVMRCLKLNGAVLAAMRSEREGEIFIVLTAADSHASIDSDKCFNVLITLALGPVLKVLANSRKRKSAKNILMVAQLAWLPSYSLVYRHSRLAR